MGISSDFETQGRRHLKSKTGVAMRQCTNGPTKITNVIQFIENKLNWGFRK